MLAGRKLLLADDSLTIQKVIELTFADEGVRVIAFGNGDEAIEHLDEVAPDIVLADVFMPGKSGYEVCQHIKHNEKLKHIPVMLLVGSFEPFDEAEARKVGADDILTKPFQSIRRLIDRVGSLVGSRPVEEDGAPTAELRHSDADARVAVDEKLSTDQLARTTADTQPLPADLRAEMAENKVPAFAGGSIGEHRMESTAPNMRHDAQVDDSLLDLGDIEPVNAAADDDFVLDLEVEDEGQNGSENFSKLYDTPASSHRSFVEPAIMQTSAPEHSSAADYGTSTPSWVPETYEAQTYPHADAVDYDDQVHEISAAREYVPTEEAPARVAPTSEVPTTGSAVAVGNLTPEMIDAIARRAVELMSDKVVREIAWEVVPELAELLIKRQLEEKESKTR